MSEQVHGPAVDKEDSAPSRPDRPPGAATTVASPPEAASCPPVAVPSVPFPGSGPGAAPIVRHRRGALVLLASAQFVLMAGMTIAVVSLPAIRDDLALSPARASWVVTAYVVTFGGFLLLGGRLADLVGRKRLFLIGLVGFTIASLLCAVAWNETVLVAGRALQGLGGAVAAPAAMSLLTTIYATQRERLFALGVWAAVGGAGATLGNVVGGLLTSTVGWRWIFVFNIPIGVAAVVAGAFLLPTLVPAHRRQIDYLGAASVTVGLGLLIFGLGIAPQQGATAPPVLVALGAALALLVFFVARQVLLPYALVPLPLFRNRGSFAFVLIILAGIANMGPYYLGSIVLQDHLGYTPLQTGLAFVPWAALMAVVAQVVSGYVDRIGPPYVLSVSFLLATAGTAWMTVRLESLTFGTGILPAFLLLGLGAGGIMVSAMITGMTSLPGHDQGLAAGLANAGQQIGTALSIAILVSVAAARTQSLRAAGIAVTANSLEGIQLALWMTVVVGAVSAVASLVILPRRLRDLA